jgi:hypothetical protein
MICQNKLGILLADDKNGCLLFRFLPSFAFLLSSSMMGHSKSPLPFGEMWVSIGTTFLRVLIGTSITTATVPWDPDKTQLGV